MNKKVFLLLCCLYGTIAYGQVYTGKSAASSIDTQSGGRGQTQYVLTRDKLNAFPSDIEIEGVIVDSTLAWRSCGYLCCAGTLKIKLTTMNGLYYQEYVYVVVECMNEISEKLRRKRKWHLRKIYTGVEVGCVETASNKFNTMGLPFYVLLDDY